jgi:hypothetical protein
MKQWRASIEYDKSNTVRLAKALEKSFHWQRRLALFMAGFAIVALGFVLGIQNTYGLAFIAIGCLLLTNTDAQARKKARTITSQLKGYVPQMRYTFSEKSFLGETDRESNSFAYDQLIRLMDDGKFLYLFKDRETAFMVDKSTVLPAESPQLKEQVSVESGLRWIQYGSILNTGLITLIKQYGAQDKQKVRR